MNKNTFFKVAVLTVFVSSAGIPCFAFGKKDSVEKEHADLRAQAVLSEADAVAKAQKLYPSFTFSVDSLCKDDGIVMYELNGRNTAGKKQEVNINAADGTVVKN